jgi:hypothetical protein
VTNHHGIRYGFWTLRGEMSDHSAPRYQWVTSLAALFLLLPILNAIGRFHEWRHTEDEK